MQVDTVCLSGQMWWPDSFFPPPLWVLWGGSSYQFVSSPLRSQEVPPPSTNVFIEPCFAAVACAAASCNGFLISSSFPPPFFPRSQLQLNTTTTRYPQGGGGEGEEENGLFCGEGRKLLLRYQSGGINYCLIYYCKYRTRGKYFRIFIIQLCEIVCTVFIVMETVKKSST